MPDNRWQTSDFCFPASGRSLYVPGEGRRGFGLKRCTKPPKICNHKHKKTRRKTLCETNHPGLKQMIFLYFLNLLIYFTRLS
jgi:hypothetical protein